MDQGQVHRAATSGSFLARKFSIASRRGFGAIHKGRAQLADQE
jgi:hypothetical protein